MAVTVIASARAGDTLSRYVDDLHASVAARQQTMIEQPDAMSGTARKLADAELVRARRLAPLMSARDLMRKFAAADTRLDDVRRGRAYVPAIFLASLPRDMASLRSVQIRKRVFIKAVLPLILKANRSIARQRELLIYLRRAEAEGRPLSSFDRQFLTAIAERYDVTVGDWDEMLARVDIVPPSLALAQAAEESGWGTSRFARQGNAVYGQRTFTRGTGMVPRDRGADDNYEVRRFDTLYGSIESYVRNLNTHPAHATFRVARAALRKLDGGIDSLRLAGALERYSERGPAYADNIRKIIQSNRLRQFDRARLADHEEAALRIWRSDQPS